MSDFYNVMNEDIDHQNAVDLVGRLANRPHIVVEGPGSSRASTLYQPDAVDYLTEIFENSDGREAEASHDYGWLPDPEYVEMRLTEDYSNNGFNETFQPDALGTEVPKFNLITSNTRTDYSIRFPAKINFPRLRAEEGWENGSLTVQEKGARHLGMDTEQIRELGSLESKIADLLERKG